jgi:RNA polymerase primary sigma factor
MESKRMENEMYPRLNLSAEDLGRKYIDEITQTPLLTAEEEVTLSKQIARAREARVQLASGDVSPNKAARLQRTIEEGAAARERMLMANTRLVVSVAKKYRDRGIPFLDLVHEGLIGLIRATKKFDPDKGNRFSTYATWWIRQAITRAIDNTGRTIRLPVHKSVEINRLSAARNRLVQELGQEPTEEEIAVAISRTPEEVRETIRIGQVPISLELPQDDGDDRELGDTLADTESTSPDEYVTNQIMEEQVRSVIDALPMREAQVLLLRYGFKDGRSYTLQEVGDRMGITRERVRQIESQALRKLKTTVSDIELSP